MSWSQAFLAETVQTGIENRCVAEATHVLRRKLGKDKCDLEFFRKGLVHEFYRLKALITLEQLNTSVVGKKNRRILICKTSLVRLTGLSLYAAESCDEHAVNFRR